MFLVPLPTIQARITRAKKKITGSNIPYRIPTAPDLPERLSSVLAVIYLIYTAGHTSPDGAELHNPELVDRATELARALVQLMPDEREARGLLALILLNEARRAARTDHSGDLILLEHQDRSKWDRRMISEGLTQVTVSLTGGSPGKYALQAAIAGVHAGSASWEATDWDEIVGLYDVLHLIWPTPVVALNRIAAVSMASGPEQALRELSALEQDARLASYAYLPATRADLFRRLNRFSEAADAYRDALVLTTNNRERSFLLRRLAEVTSA
jgi:RNA polymerase sigma-70 factor (ECF subfamily)